MSFFNQIFEVKVVISIIICKDRWQVKFTRNLVPFCVKRSRKKFAIIM